MLYRAGWLPSWLEAQRTILPGAFPLLRSGLKRWWRRLHGAEEGVTIRRINEKVHWSVRERLGRPEALDSRVGRARYAPANLAAVLARLTDADVTTPTPLELRLQTHPIQTPSAAAGLLAPPVTAASTCPLVQQGGKCRCCGTAPAGDGDPLPAVAA
jgi:hypothetical protein